MYSHEPKEWWLALTIANHRWELAGIRDTLTEDELTWCQELAGFASSTTAPGWEIADEIVRRIRARTPLRMMQMNDRTLDGAPMEYAV